MPWWSGCTSEGPLVGFLWFWFCRSLFSSAVFPSFTISICDVRVLWTIQELFFGEDLHVPRFCSFRAVQLSALSRRLVPCCLDPKQTKSVVGLYT